MSKHLRSLSAREKPERNNYHTISDISLPMPKDSKSKQPSPNPKTSEYKIH